MLSVYTGPETKLISNQGKLKFKRSRTDFTLNKMYIIQAISVVIIASVLGALGYQFLRQYRDQKLYIFEGLHRSEERPVIIVLTFWLLLVRFLPLDAVLISETSKMIYSKFIEADARLMSVDRSTGEIIKC